MFYLRLIIFWGLFITILSAFSSISVDFVDLIPGLTLMWFLYLIFISTANYTKSITTNSKIFFTSERDWLIFPITVCYLIFFPLYIQFYTGSNFTLLLLNIANGMSNYQSYQEYFADAGLGQFSIAKLPYILIAGIFKFLFVGILVKVIAFKKKILWYEFICIILMIIMNLIVAFSRGTSFELFEIFVALVFCLLLRRRRKYMLNWFSATNMLIIGLLSAVIILYFGYNIDLRGEFLCTTNEFCYKEDGFFNAISTIFGKLSYQLSGYFVFGTFFTSMALMNVNFSSFLGFISLFLPNQMYLMGMPKESYKSLVCDKAIDCGAAWIPDLILQIQSFGLIGLIVIVILLAFISSKLFGVMLNGSVFAGILIYFIFLYMISLPVGNFIASSSSNIISIIIAFIFYKTPRIRGLLFKYLT